MSLKNILIVAVVITTLVVAGLYFAGAFNLPPEQHPPYPVQEGVNNTFAFELYNELAEQKQGNIFFSPQSARVALAMAAEGARGNTRTEMLSVLHLSDDDSARRQYFKNMMSSLPESVEEANGMWLLNDYPYEKKFLNTLKEYYDAEAGPLNLDAINSWTKEKTHGKIEKILESLPPLTRLVLTNAVYFKGTWKYQFLPNNTKSELFHTPDGARTVEMMHLYPEPEQNFKYYEDDEVQVLDLPYSDDRLSMIIVLPKEADASVSLSKEKIETWLDEMKNTSLKEIAIPKFKIETEYQLIPALQSMGMKAPFDPGKADFSGITKAEGLFISVVKQKAFVQVDEEGTEATAVTVIVFKTVSISPPLPRFIADHPFVFMIRDKQTGGILFMGRVSDPGVEGG